MPRDQFLFRKKNQLAKIDKSLKQHLDDKIIKLCNLINKNKDYYTTSSCSGRILLLINSRKKRGNLFIKIWHDLISFEELKKTIKQIKGRKLIYFKQEPCILHVACRTLKHAQKIHDLGKLAGWKRCGIIATKKRFVVELNATDKLEFPVFENDKILASDDFLKVAVREANKKLESSWDKIERLEKLADKNIVFVYTK